MTLKPRWCSGTSGRRLFGFALREPAAPAGFGHVDHVALAATDDVAPHQGLDVLLAHALMA
jgi:hypothetical protein